MKQFIKKVLNVKDCVIEVAVTHQNVGLLAPILVPKS